MTPGWNRDRANSRNAFVDGQAGSRFQTGMMFWVWFLALFPPPVGEETAPPLLSLHKKSPRPKGAGV